MACYKNLSFAAACALNDCELHPFVPFGTDDYALGIAYAPDLCYCLTSSMKNDSSESYLKKYNPDTNDFDLKATIPGYMAGELIYDPVHQKFVEVGTAGIIVFDPIAETYTTFAHGLTGLVGQFVWNQQMGMICGSTGWDGATNQQCGVVDLDANLVIPLGSLPMVGPVHPYPYCWTLCTSNNSFYGPFITGMNSGVMRFDFDTSTGSLVTALSGIAAGYDSDRDLVVTFFNFVNEIDPATGGIVYTGPIDPDYDPITRMGRGDLGNGAPIYISALSKFCGCGRWVVDGEDCAATYDPATRTCEVIDSAYGYYKIISLNDGSCIGLCFTRAVEFPEGVRRICVT